MSLRVLLIAGIAAKLFAVLPVALAQSTAATCLTAFSWMDNSRGQNPCLVAAYAQGACTGGQFTVDPLAPDHHYTGPYVSEANSCQCSTVVYSLISACAVCQNRTIETWSAWDTNCTQLYLLQFPEQIPSGTSIPAWAYLDVVSTDTFSAAAAQADLSAPESSATGTKPTGTVSTTVAYTSSGFGSTATSVGSGGPGSASASKKSNAGAIAGGVVGGLAGLGIIAALVTFFIMHRRRTQVAPSATYGNFYTSRSDAPLNSPPVNSVPLSSSPPMSQNPYNNQAPRLYDPSDPSTYPQSPPSPTIHTTNSGPVPQPYGQPPQPGYYSGVPEL